MVHIRRIDEMRTFLRGVKFPIDTINRNGEKIRITKDMYEGKTIYILDIDNGQFNYTTSDFEDCLGYARLTISDIR